MFGLVAVIIVVGMAIKLQPVTEEAQATGAKLAKVWMLDSVQRYHQAWLVQGEPNYMEMDGFQLTMTEGGGGVAIHTTRRTRLRILVSCSLPAT